MAITKGTNAGFVSAAPSADPDGTGGVIKVRANKDTSPTGSYKVTEIGWYQSLATCESEAYEMAIYSHDAVNDKPNAAIGSISTGQTTGTTAGWKKYTGLSISLTSATSYWIALGCAWTGTYPRMDYVTGYAGVRYATNAESTLSDPFGTCTGVDETYIAIYALYESTVTDLSISMSECVGSTGHLA